MRRAFSTKWIAVASVLIATFPSAAPALAQEATFDAAQAAHALAEIQQLAREYQVLMNSYTQLQSTVQSLQHLNPNIMTLATGLRTLSAQLPGSSPSRIPGMTFGQGISGPGQQFYGQNHVYTSTSNDWSAQEMQRRQVATANCQGEANAGMQMTSGRLSSLQNLEDGIPLQPDVHAIGALNTRIASEHNYLANENVHVLHLHTLCTAQPQVDQQRQEQHDRQMHEQWAATVGAQAGW